MAFPLSTLLALLILPLLTWQQNLNVQTCSKGNSAKIQPSADAWIGGIISLNEPGTGGYGCGKPDGDMQAYEAIRWVLDLLNKKNETIQTQFVSDYYVPGIRLGMSIRNYCGKQLSAAAAVMDIYPEMSLNSGTCTSATTQDFTLGIIGPTTSDDAITVSDAVVTNKISVVSYEATATQLTMPGLHPNFMRTTSPDGPLMEVIIQVMTKLQWNYIVVVYDSGTYGRQAYNELHARAIASGICLTASIMVDADNLGMAKDTLNRVLGTNATGVIYFGPSNFAKAIISEGNGMLPMAGRLQWLITDISLDTIFANTSVYQRGLILVSAASRKIVEFEDHWIRINEANPSPENPWFTGWYEDKYNCKFNPTAGQMNCNSLYGNKTSTEKEIQKRAEFQQSLFVESAVMAVYTYARALRTAQMNLCPGVSGICSNLAAMSRETFMNDFVKKVSFTFTSDERVPSLASRNIAPYNAAKRLSFTPYGDITDPSYYIYNYNNIETGSASNAFKFRLVGSYIGSYLDLNLDSVGMYSEDRQVRLRPLPSSPCPVQGCTPCLGLPSQFKYYFEQGDIIVNGIFSLHQMGSTPLTCGLMMSVNQYIFLEAMIYAVKLVNQDNSTLNNIILGGLGMDDCSSSTLGQAFISQVVRGNFQIKTTAGSQLDPGRIEAYSAAHTTTLTLPLAEAMNILMKPMVGYRAGGSQLDNRFKYPYYIRAVPGNYEEMKAVVLFLKSMNWMFIQVVTSSNKYSQDSEKILRELASEAGICIVATHNISQTSQGAMDVVTGLSINSATQPTVVLLEQQDIRRLLEAFNNTMTARSRIVLIGTSMWGTDGMVVKDVESAAEGTITLRLRSSTLSSFRSYLGSLNVNSYTLNPWFKEWYAAVHNCSLGDQGSGAPCNQSKPITDGVNFQLIYQVEGVINAIRAIGYGLDSTLRFYCGANYNAICSEFLTSKDKGMRFLELIKSVSFPVEDINPSDTFGFAGYSAKIPFEVNYYTQRSYSMVGGIQPWLNTITMNSNNIDQLKTNVRPSCPASCLDCLFLLNDYWYIPGDLVIGAIFDVHYSGNGPFSCGALRTRNGALYTEVFNFALQKINSGISSVRLRNVTLGGLALDGCSSPDRATAIVNRVHTGVNIFSVTGEKFMASNLISWMSYDSQTTIDAATLVQKLNMPIVSPGATARELDNKQKYYTFFRTIPSDSVVVLGMAEFVRYFNKKYVIVLNAPDTSSRESRDLFRQYLTEFGICIVANYEFRTDGTMDSIVNNIASSGTYIVAVFAEPDNYINDFLAKSGNLPLKFVANRPWGENIAKNYATLLKDSVFFDLNVTRNYSEFISYLAKRLNENNSPWFLDIYQAFMDCDFPGTFRGKQSCTSVSSNSVSGWEQDIWTLSTINAVFALAEGVHRTLQIKCGADYTTVCPDFMYSSDVHNLIMSNMDTENFTDIMDNFFSFIQREANTNYLLMRYFSASSITNEGSLDRVGHLTLVNQNLLNGVYADVKSECTGDCLVCSTVQSNYQDFTFISGDFYIVGLFDVHKQGKTPFTCGEINNEHGLPLLEAFNYALEYVNSNSGIFKNVLPGIMLGGIALDMCQSPSRAAELVANIQSGNIQISKNGINVNPSKIDAYVAAMDTESTIRVADILQQLAIPQISYGATGMDLLNRQKYSYFLRSVPADDKQARTMVSYLKKLNYNNIQVINSFDEVGEPGMLEFKRLANVNKICVKIEYTIGRTGNIVAEAPMAIYNLSKNMDAQVIILWLKNPLPILEAASQNNDVSKNMLFIATNKWGANPEYLTLMSIRNLLQNKNLVILDVETADIIGFDQYLETKNPDNYQTNPWFKEYFEMYRNCSWDTTSGGKTLCDKSMSIPRTKYYKQDTYVLYVMNAVFSVALGIDSAIRNKCYAGQSTYYGVCNLYTTSGERRQLFMENLQKVNFTDDTHQPFYFTEDGQSVRGFHIYNITNTSANEYNYETIGSYNDTHFLKLDITYDTNFKAQCDANNDNCTCKFKKDVPSSFLTAGDGLAVVYVGDIHQASPTSRFGCGPLNTGLDLQKVLAFFYAINKVNNLNLPKFLKLNGIAIDSCTHGLRLGQDIYSIISGNKGCDSDSNSLLVAPSTITAFIIDKDKNSLPVANMLSLQNITSISPTAGSVLLSNKYMYPYFLRTCGDNLLTANVILQMVQSANWDYLSVIYTDRLDYKGMADSLMDSSRQMSTCVGDAVPLPVNASVADAQQALERVSQQVGARTLVLFVDPSQINLLMEASRSLGLTGRFVWVVGSDWDENSNPVTGYEQELAGALIVNMRSAMLWSFTEYVKSLNFTNRGGIPDDLFYEIYETFHQCNIINFEYQSGNRFTKTCTLAEVITDAMVQQDPSVIYVILSVYSVAYGLENIPECIVSPYELSACLQTLSPKYDKIYKGILGADFIMPELTGNSTFPFSFNMDGNGQTSYVIENYRITFDNSQNPYKTYEIGQYSAQGLVFDKGSYAAGNLFDMRIPTSNCAPGTVCSCQLSNNRKWSYSAAETLDPSNVQVGKTYKDPLTGDAVTVEAVPSAGDRFSEGWAIILSILACLGAVVTLVIFVYLLIMYPNRGGTTILGYILCFGIFLLYLMAFPFIAHADIRMCGLRRFGLGFVYSIVYSTLLVKLIDCFRVSAKSDPFNIKYSKLGTPLGFFMVTLFLVLVQVIINAEWLILVQPEITRIFYKNQYWPLCMPHDFYDKGLVLSLVYIMVIIFVSLILGLATFTSKVKNHHENRWIFCILIVSIICWVIWCTASIMGAMKIRDAAVVVGLLVNATAMLLLMPVRKLFLLHKYHVTEEQQDEAEKQSTIAPSLRGTDRYSVYGRQYDNNPKLHDAASTRGSMYAYS